jgi:hypothetical protein
MPLSLIAIPLAVYAVTIPNSFVNGTPADANEVNANFAALAVAFNLHEPAPSAHHVKTTAASELTSGVLSDARLSANVSLLGPLVNLGELGFDPATEAELGAHTSQSAAHHTRYANSEAIAAVGPHVTSLDGLTGGSVAGFIRASAEIESTAGGFRFPDSTVQETAAQVFPNRLLVAPSGGDFTSIQTAINKISPTAGSPWLIEIAAGTYVEELTLKSHVHLKGAGIEATVIQPPSTTLHHVTATSVTGVKLSSLTLEDEQAVGPSVERAIAATGSEVELEDVRITGYGKELIDAISSTLAIRDSDFRDPLFDLDRGIHLFQSSANVTGSTLNTRDCAIDAERSELTLTRSVVFFELCANGSANPPRAILVSQNRLASIRIEGAARGEIVGNEIRGDTGRVNFDSSEPGQLVGNIIDFTDTTPAVVVSGAVAVIGNQIQNTAPAGDGILNFGTAQIIGNTIDVTGTAIVDAQDALIVANIVVGSPATAISGTATSVLMGNRVPSGYSADTEERWLSSRKIRVESTSEGIEFEAGGSTVMLAPSGNITIQAAGDLDLNGTNVNISASAQIDLTAGSVVDLNGAQITLN